MRFKLLFQNLKRSKLAKRSAVALLPLLLTALAITFGAGRADHVDGSRAARALPAAPTPQIAPGSREANRLPSGIAEGQAYLSDFSEHSAGVTSALNDQIATTIDSGVAPNSSEDEVMALNDDLGLSQFLEARVTPASTLNETASSTTGWATAYMNGVQTGSGVGSVSGMGAKIPDMKAPGGTKNRDALDPLGIADIPSNSGHEDADHPTSVPEPETWALWMIGLTGCFFSRRRSSAVTN